MAFQMMAYHMSWKSWRGIDLSRDIPSSQSLAAMA
jgi:hypothetical protein